MKNDYYVSNEKVRKIYECLNDTRRGQFGTYRKTIFHLHTPESYDYKLLEHITEVQYEQMSADDIFDIIVAEKIIPNDVIRCEQIEYDKSLYKELKDYLSYYLIASRLIAEEVEIVVITDHNTIAGYEKLERAIQDNWNLKRGKKYPEIICGIEISCADKNHIVGIFDIKANKKLKNDIEAWVDEFVMSPKEGTYLSSVEVLNKINEWKGSGYIAHIDTTDIFKEKYLSLAFKKALFTLDFLEVIGISNVEKIEDIKRRIYQYTKKEFSFVVDDDAHCIEDIGKKAFWIKGVASDYKTIKKAIKDYNISIELKEPEEPTNFIKGIYVIGKDEGFLSGKKGKGDFVITFSSALNCFIGGRGTGKSTVLQIIDFVLGQNYVSDNRLELICGNKEVWILYSKNGIDYLILFNGPLGEFDEMISAVVQMRRDLNKYNKGTNHNERTAVQKKYIQIYRLRMNHSILEQKEMIGVSELLSEFFDTKYSVNELVQIASTMEISNYVKSTIQKNNKITKIKLPPYVRTISGLKEKLDLTEQILLEREKEILPIINEYNILHERELQIGFFYKKKVNKAINFDKIFGFEFYKKDQWFSKFNIRFIDVIQYFEDLHDLIGTISLYRMIIEGKWHEMNKLLPITYYSEELGYNLIENDITILNARTLDVFFRKISNYFFEKEAICELSKGLRYYVEHCEYYNLLFNINNKEDINASKCIFKSIDKLSMGQKVVAMLSFVLSYSDFSKDYRPLVIDQPEDNLDNQYIYKNLVKQLRDIKSKRQVIIATHNATIVTNAKAEQVIVMESDNEHGWVKASGYPNDKRIIKHIINNLEGGKDSFEHKCFIYADVIGN